MTFNLNSQPHEFMAQYYSLLTSLQSYLATLHADMLSLHTDFTSNHTDMIALHSDLLALLPKAAGRATISISPVVALTSQLILAANPNRIGVLMYNNSANSIYLSYGSAANSSNNMTRILTTFTQFAMEPPIYTGAIYGIRNAGTGTVIVTELTAS